MTAATDRATYVAQQTNLALADYDRRLRLITENRAAVTDPGDLARRVTIRAAARLVELEEFA